MANDTNDKVTLNNIDKVLDDDKTVFILSGYGQGTYSISVSYIGNGKYIKSNIGYGRLLIYPVWKLIGAPNGSFRKIS